jgi:hypothetical protein
MVTLYETARRHFIDGRQSILSNELTEAVTSINETEGFGCFLHSFQTNAWIIP